MNNPIIELEQIAVSFGKLTVHRDVSFQVGSGEVLTILGPSGSGKTVLLKIIIGLLRPSGGAVRVLGNDLLSMNEDELRQLRRNMGMLFQGAALFDSLTVFENIAYGLREFGETSEEEIAAIVREKLRLIALPGIEGKYPPELSGGQKKRVGLARALASSPKILLFDEPTTGLDPTTIRLIDELIIRLRDEYGITSLVVTHDIASARRISDRWILINNGRVVADEPIADAEQNELILEFVSGMWKAELGPAGGIPEEASDRDRDTQEPPDSNFGKPRGN